MLPYGAYAGGVTESLEHCNSIALMDTYFNNIYRGIYPLGKQTFGQVVLGQLGYRRTTCHC